MCCSVEFLFLHAYEHVFGCDVKCISHYESWSHILYWTLLDTVNGRIQSSVDPLCVFQSHQRGYVQGVHSLRVAHAKIHKKA